MGRKIITLSMICLMLMSCGAQVKTDRNLELAHTGEGQQTSETCNIETETVSLSFSGNGLEFDVSFPRITDETLDARTLNQDVAERAMRYVEEFGFYERWDEEKQRFLACEIIVNCEILQLDSDSASVVMTEYIHHDGAANFEVGIHVFNYCFLQNRYLEIEEMGDIKNLLFKNLSNTDRAYLHAEVERNFDELMLSANSQGSLIKYAITNEKIVIFLATNTQNNFIKVELQRESVGST